jgi:hypothetical protein
MVTKLVFRPRLGNYESLDIACSNQSCTILALIDAAVVTAPDVRPRLFDEDGQLHRFLAFVVGDQHIQLADLGHTMIAPQSVVLVMQAVAGG